MNNKEVSNIFSIIIIFFIALLCMLKQLASTSYFTVIVDDAFIYPSWAWQFNEALREGNIYPRWMPFDFWGYGSPAFLLYPPLAFYMTSLFNLFTGSIVPAMNLVKFTALFLSGVGIYFLVKEFYRARVALLSALFSVILPYNIFSMYNYGSFAVMVSCMWFAPILLFAFRYCMTREFRHLVYGGACYGGLILTHIISAYMFTFLLAAFALYLALVRKQIRDLVIIPAVLLTGLSLAAAYLLPVVFERKYVNQEIFTTDINYIYSNFFILPDMTARIANWRFWPIYHDTMALHAALFCLFILIFLVRSQSTDHTRDNGLTLSVNRFFLIAATASLLLMFGVSSFVWEMVPFFRLILFPPRWLHISAFCAAFLSASVFSGAFASGPPVIRRILLPLLLFLSCIALDSSFIREAIRFNGDGHPASSVYRVYEHLPRGVHIDKLDRRDDAGRETGFALLGEGIARLVSWKSSQRIIDFRADKPAAIAFRTFNFPGWRATVDGAEVATTTQAETRTILVDVPQGNHRLTLVFGDTPVRRVGKLISLVTLALLALFSFLNKSAPPREPAF